MEGNAAVALTNEAYGGIREGERHEEAYDLPYLTIVHPLPCARRQPEDDLPARLHGRSASARRREAATAKVGKVAGGIFNASIRGTRPKGERGVPEKRGLYWQGLGHQKTR
jgi:hypothetical protein